ncbi:hypothetical protein ACU5P1_20575 [Pseudomonas plecoglossicida]|uniref:hypothetical protein n=1 Tax=Pseudomonas plecoglossicida TaxID=70775 RepID=UPI00138E2AE2|nr:hypothetical protein [Pseudomonas plecoglossicida]QLB53311.1 hypothetical protein HAV28_20365 [Pseudomonas plecoglossicida]
MIALRGMNGFFMNRQPIFQVPLITIAAPIPERQNNEQTSANHTGFLGHEDLRHYLGRDGRGSAIDDP